MLDQPFHGRRALVVRFRSFQRGQQIPQDVFDRLRVRQRFVEELHELIRRQVTRVRGDDPVVAVQDKRVRQAAHAKPRREHLVLIDVHFDPQKLICERGDLLAGKRVELHFPAPAAPLGPERQDQRLAQFRRRCGLGFAGRFDRRVKLDGAGKTTPQACGNANCHEFYNLQLADGGNMRPD
jgi:hypothetical protein